MTTPSTHHAAPAATQPPRIHRCAGPACPGLPYRASLFAHPVSCTRPTTLLPTLLLALRLTYHLRRAAAAVLPASAPPLTIVPTEASR